jgi:Icc-related predicted phosphoesterase
MTVTRLFFTTDIHGSEKCFRKFVNAGKFYDAKVLILGGDITGKMVIPVIDQGDGTYSCNFLGSEMRLRSKKELDDTVRNIRDAGYYAYMSNPNEVEELQNDKAKVEGLFERLMSESIDHWVQFARERLAGTGIRCYISPGNDDIFAIDTHLTDSEPVFNPERKVVMIDDRHEMITLGYTNPTPWKSPREVDEGNLENLLEELCSKVRNMNECIFNTHVPPIDTPIDKAPALDPSFRPIVKDGHIQYTNAGSGAMRKIIEKYQPLVGIHGHIHESKGMVKVGKTICFNPGSEYTEGVLRGLILDLENSKIKNHLFTSG